MKSLPITFTIKKCSFVCALMLPGFLLLTSCMSRQFVEGEVKIISVSDSTLNDSSIFVGYVYEHPNTHSGNLIPVGNAQIWIDNSNLNATSNSAGYYYIKTLPGTYTIKCQDNGNNWPQLIESIRQIKINKNEKILVNFYLGYTIE